MDGSVVSVSQSETEAMPCVTSTRFGSPARRCRRAPQPHRRSARHPATDLEQSVPGSKLEDRMSRQFLTLCGVGLLLVPASGQAASGITCDKPVVTGASFAMDCAYPHHGT